MPRDQRAEENEQERDRRNNPQELPRKSSGGEQRDAELSDSHRGATNRVGEVQQDDLITDSDRSGGERSR